MIESDLIGIELPMGAQPLLQVCTALLQAEINIVQAYPLIVRPRGRPAVALMVDNVELAMETLDAKGFRLVTEADLIGRGVTRDPRRRATRLYHCTWQECRWRSG